MEHNLPLLTDILVVFGISIIILLICHRLGIPAVVGLLLTGLVAGPYGLGLVEAAEEVEVLAEIGVVLLLFTIGIEFSMTKLFEIRRSVLLGGAAQVIGTTGLTFAVALLFGASEGTALFIGFLVSLSSTAIVLRSLHEKAEIESPHGRTSLAVLIFQDIAIVPMMLVTPLLAGKAEDPVMTLLVLLGKGIGVVAFALLSAKFFVPWLLYQVARTRSRELFVLSMVVICFAVAWITSTAGLSLGLGAFLAGLIISDSEYSYQALGGIMPFRDVFTSFFFVSIGMLLDVSLLVEEPLLIGALVVAVLLGKGVIAAAVARLLRQPLRTMVLVGIALSQIGEFSFVLAKVGLDLDLLKNETYQTFLAVSVLTMTATPFLLSIGPRLANLMLRAPLPDALRAGMGESGDYIQGGEKIDLKNHLIIVGYGVNGRNIARAAKAGAISYVIIETNAETVKREQEKGTPIIYGDASYDAVLERARVEDARVLVIVVNDPIATRNVIQTAKRLNEEIYIIVRTRYLREMEALVQLGASEVIPEEFETSIEIFTRVLTKYMVPRDEIEDLIYKVRADEYQILRTLVEPTTSITNLVSELPEVDIMSVRVAADSRIVGRTLAETDLRQRYGITLLEIRRGGEILVNPAASTEFLADDILIVMGSPSDVMRFSRRVKAAAIDGHDPKK